MRTAPEVFDQDEDGLVVVLDPRPSTGLRPAVDKAAELCPTTAIRTT